MKISFFQKLLIHYSLKHLYPNCMFSIHFIFSPPGILYMMSNLLSSRLSLLYLQFHWYIISYFVHFTFSCRIYLYLFIQLIFRKKQLFCNLFYMLALGIQRPLNLFCVSELSCVSIQLLVIFLNVS